jgi:hypothetical protein
MMGAYAYLDDVLARNTLPFAPDTKIHVLELNNRVHYNDDPELRREYAHAIDENEHQFSKSIDCIDYWYIKHKNRGDDPRKLAAEVYVSVLGYPQLFIEGNHRTGALIASWINVVNNYQPFVLSAENAIAYFFPSAEIKRFADRSTWR